MKREDKMNELAKGLLETAQNAKDKKTATILISSFDTEDGEKVGTVIAISGNIFGLATVIFDAMERNEDVRMAIKAATEFYEMNEHPGFSFPLG